MKRQQLSISSRNSLIKKEIHYEENINALAVSLVSFMAMAEESGVFVGVGLGANTWQRKDL